MRSIDKLKTFHAKEIEPYTRHPLGASEAEVSDLERQLGFSLPADYREFLLWFGRDYNGVLRGTDTFIDHVLENTEELPNLLAKNGLEEKLPKQFVCPFMHQGYIATWFEVPTCEDDPKGFYFNESESEKGIVSAPTIMTLFYTDISGMAIHLKK